MPPAVMTKVMPMLITPMIEAKRMIVRKLLDVHEAVARGDGADDDEQHERDDEAEVATGGAAQHSLHDVAATSREGPPASALRAR